MNDSAKPTESAKSAEVAKPVNAESAKPASPVESANPAKSAKRRISGVVICDKADKTIRIRADRRVRHALYEKIIRRRGGVQAHDAGNICRVGDNVIVEEMPRCSKTKSWRVVERQGEAV